jgi:hypothetical protein
MNERTADAVVVALAGLAAGFALALVALRWAAGALSASRDGPAENKAWTSERFAALSPDERIAALIDGTLPPELGVEVLLWIIANPDELEIFLGSARNTETLENPWLYGEDDGDQRS